MNFFQYKAIKDDLVKTHQKKGVEQQLHALLFLALTEHFLYTISKLLPVILKYLKF